MNDDADEADEADVEAQSSAVGDVDDDDEKVVRREMIERRVRGGRSAHSLRFVFMLTSAMGSGGDA